MIGFSFFEQVLHALSCSYLMVLIFLLDFGHIFPLSSEEGLIMFSNYWFDALVGLNNACVEKYIKIGAIGKIPYEGVF